MVDFHLFNFASRLSSPSGDSKKVSTQDIVDKALSIDSKLRNGDFDKLKNWDYDFMNRRHLSVRTRTRRSQITESAMQSVKQDYCRMSWLLIIIWLAIRSIFSIWMRQRCISTVPRIALHIQRVRKQFLSWLEALHLCDLHWLSRLQWIEANYLYLWYSKVHLAVALRDLFHASYLTV